MPPKKGKKDGPAKFADKENLARAETEVLSLQRLIELRSHESVEARRSERLWRERVDAFASALEQQKEDTLDITSDMLRQYKAMQEQMAKRIAELEADNRGLRRAAEDKDGEIAKLQAEKEALRKAADGEIGEYQRRMEDMQLEFAQMLRDTLDKMHARLAAGLG